MRHLSVVILGMLAVVSAAQEPVELSGAYRMAVDADPRLRTLEIEAAASRLRLRNIESERRPSLGVEGKSQYQSEVVEFPSGQTGGTATLSPPHETYEAALRVEHSLVDPTEGPRIAVERARLEEAHARIRTAMFALRQEVDEAFFSAALLQEREAQIEVGIKDLEARWRDAQLRIAQGVALPSEADSIEATMLRRRQDLAEVQALRRAALSRLAALTDHEYSINDALILPQLDDRIAAVRGNLNNLRARPEFTEFARARDLIEAQKDIIGAASKPRVAVYGLAAWGSPGLNFLREDFHPYGLAGIRVQWRPWNWGTDGRERQLLALQQEAIAAEEEAFARRLNRRLVTELASLDHLREAASLDDRIVTLREAIERETRLRFDEGVVTAAQYVDSETDVLEARLLRATHRVQLAQAQAQVLTLVGLEID